MLKVIEHQDMIRENLILDFWDLVRQELDNLNETRNNKWQIEMDEDYLDKDSSLYLIKDTWKIGKEDLIFSVEWGGLSNKFFYGVWINVDLHETWKTEKIKTTLKTKSKKMGFNSDKYYPMYNYYGNYNFNDFDDLVHILPDKRETLATEFANILLKFANDMEKDLDEMVIKYKKPVSNT